MKPADDAYTFIEMGIFASGVNYCSLGNLKYERSFYGTTQLQAGFIYNFSVLKIFAGNDVGQAPKNLAEICVKQVQIVKKILQSLPNSGYTVNFYSYS